MVPPMLITRPAACRSRPRLGAERCLVEPGIVLVWKAWTSFTQPQSNSTVPPRFGSLTVLDALLAEPAGELDDRHAVARRCACATADRVGDVVGVAVGDQDVGRLDLVGGHRRDRVVAASGTGRRARAASPSESSKHDVAEESDLHQVQSSSFDSSV